MAGILDRLFGKRNPLASAEAGARRGLEQMADAVKMTVAAIRSGDAGTLSDMGGVLELWLAEATDAAGVVKDSAVDGLILGTDPFRGSREALRKVKARRGGKV